MPSVAIVYFSGYGHTEQQAQAVIEGARSVSGADVKPLRIDEDGSWPDDTFDILAACDAMIFGSPTYMGGPAWQFKKFADASSKPWFELAWKDKIAAGFTTSASVNGDKSETLSYFQTLAQQHGQIWVGVGLPPANKLEHGPDDLNWTGGFAGAYAIAPADSSPDQAPRKGDLDTARHLGRRVVETAGRFTG